MKLVLSTANARYKHCSFGLRRLGAELTSHGFDVTMAEFTIQQSPFEIADTLLRHFPQVIGFGIYIWNVELLTRVARQIRLLRPDIILVGGGPELADELDTLPLFQVLDYVIVGEGEAALTELACCLRNGQPWELKVIHGPLPELKAIASPYTTYTEEDIRNRIVYVESSRGCPYRCAFCLSSGEGPVRYFPLPQFLDDMLGLLQRGVRLFKFTDRTFNANDQHAKAVLEFFLKQYREGLQLHFEIMPDRLSPPLRALMAAFPPEALHLEVGVQTVNTATQRTIHRCQSMAKTLETLSFLRNETGALLHGDLIVGLPGDTIQDIAEGFDLLVNAKVHEIQVGLLKRLKGTPLAGTVGKELKFDPYPPYEVLQTPALAFSEIQHLKRFARYFDMVYNSGNFPESVALLWELSPSPFKVFNELTSHIWTVAQRTHGIALSKLSEHLYAFLTVVKGYEPNRVKACIEHDFRRVAGRKDKLDFS